MSLLNLSKETVLAKNVKVARSFLSRLKGLMFSRSYPQEFQALIITPCNAVHTIFMSYPIDVLFIDKKWQVLHCCHILNPGKLSPVVRGAYAAVELPAGTVIRSYTQKGDVLSLVYERSAVRC